MIEDRIGVVVRLIEDCIGVTGKIKSMSHVPLISKETEDDTFDVSQLGKILLKLEEGYFL